MRLRSRGVWAAHATRLGGVLVAVGLSSCGGPISQASEYDGSWTGSWKAIGGTTGSLEMSLRHTSEDVGGSVSLGGTLCVGSGQMVATVDESGAFSGSFSNGVGGAVSIDGDLDEDTKAFTGRFQVTGGVCKGTSGTFSLKH